MRFMFNYTGSQARVIGPPRSGTNYIKFLLDNNSRIASGFHVGWWKHGVIPPLMDAKGAIPDKVFSIIMVRDLRSQVTSFWRFCQQGRGAIMSDAEDFAQFVRSPMYMRSFKDMTYYFDTPLAYLAQFYWAAKQHKGEKLFLKLEDAQAQPELLFQSLKQTDRFQRLRLPEKVVTPDGYMGRNADKTLSGTASYEGETSLEQEQRRTSQLIESLKDDDVAYIERSEAAKIIGNLPSFVGEQSA